MSTESPKIGQNLVTDEHFARFYAVAEVLGTGSFSTVYKAVHLPSREPVVCGDTGGCEGYRQDLRRLLPQHPNHRERDDGAGQTAQEPQHHRVLRGSRG